MNEIPIGVFRECTNSNCRFRYPDIRIDLDDDYCPVCGDHASISNYIFSKSDKKPKLTHSKRPRRIALLDNIRSVYNVGSIFRTCEGLGVTEMILAGITPTPDHPRLSKTGLGAEKNISWQHQNNACLSLSRLRNEGVFIIGLECTEKSKLIQTCNENLYDKHVCLVAGNERLGIDPVVQDLCDFLVCIPMQGVKESFNVSVAFAIAAFYLLGEMKIV